jgi:hypothetical protein
MKQKALKPFIRYIRLDYGHEVQPWAEILSELGYTLYEMPTENYDGIFVSNVPLTQKWVMANNNRFNIKLHGWKPNAPDEELDEYNW